VYTATHTHICNDVYTAAPSNHRLINSTLIRRDTWGQEDEGVEAMITESHSASLMPPVIVDSLHRDQHPPVGWRQQPRPCTALTVLKAKLILQVCI
jgi:hypothetical protein